MASYVFTIKDYTRALHGLLPRGRVWTTDQDSVQSQVIASLSPTWQRTGQAGLNLLVDGFPATAVNLLPEWEASLGLPDPCAGPSPTVSARQRQVVARFIGVGGQSAAYFIAYAKALGYTITVSNMAPFRCGLSAAGDPVGSADWAHTWRINAPLTSTSQFTCGASSAGDPLQSWGNQVLECELRSIAPAQSILQFSYT